MKMGPICWEPSLSISRLSHFVLNIIFNSFFTKWTWTWRWCSISLILSQLLISAIVIEVGRSTPTSTHVVSCIWMGSSWGNKFFNMGGLLIGLKRMGTQGFLLFKQEMDQFHSISAPTFTGESHSWSEKVPAKYHLKSDQSVNTSQTRSSIWYF